MSRGRRYKLTTTILSLSLLTVMAGAAVAPALDVIQTHFCNISTALVQMIISVPALFIALTNLVFPVLASKYKSKDLLMCGLILYVAGGCLAGSIDNIYVVLVFRTLVGVGVGIIMPMSTGLLSFYYTRDKQDKLMGYSSAMNQMGGVVATLISGILANISWRASFLVYLLGIICIVLVLLFLPNERIGENNTSKKDNQNTKNVILEYEHIEKNERLSAGSSAKKSIFKEYYMFVVAMFLLMFTFFVYPSSYAIETIKEGIIDQKHIPVIMAILDFIAFFGGLSFVHIRKFFGINTRFIAPVLFVLGYAMLYFAGGWVGSITGSILIGFANGVGIPFIIATASKKAGRNAATTVLPLISIALYLAQFTTPFILSIVENIACEANHISYISAMISGILLTIWSVTIKDDNKIHDKIIQED